MFFAHARWFLLAGLSGSALLACGSDAAPDNGGTAGMSSGGSAAGNQTGGSTSTAGTSSTAGTLSGGGSGTAGTPSTAGTGGAAAGSGSGGTAGSGGSAGSSGGTGGASAGAGGGGAGGGAAMPTAVFDIKGIGANPAAGKATFTQGATMTKMVLELTACPNGPHASHLHLMKDCSQDGVAAGGHWVPNGEGLGDYTCAANKVTYEFSKATSVWTVGGDKATDVTQYAFMVHEMGGAAPGGRIGCGIATIK